MFFSFLLFVFLSFFIQPSGVLAQIQNDRNITYNLDEMTPELYFDMDNFKEFDFLIVKKAAGESLNIFYIGILLGGANNFELYDGSELIGRLGNLSIWTGDMNSYIPLSYTTSSEIVVIKVAENIYYFSQTALFFTIEQEYSIFQSFEAAATVVGNGTDIKIVTSSTRPRRTAFYSFATDSEEDIVVTGGTYNNSVSYFSFNSSTAQNFYNPLYFNYFFYYGSVFNFHLPEDKTLTISYGDFLDAYTNNKNPYDNECSVATLNFIGTITSPDYGEASRIQPVDSTASTLVISNIDIICFQLILKSRTNMGFDAVFYIQDSLQNNYSLISQKLNTPFWITAKNFTVYYKDSVFSSFLLTFQLLECEKATTPEPVSTSTLSRFTYYVTKTFNSTITTTTTTTTLKPTAVAVAESSEDKVGWIIIAVPVICICGGILTWFGVRYVHKRTQKRFIDRVLSRMEAEFKKSSVEMKLSHEERMKMMFSDFNDVSVDLNMTLGEGSYARVHKAFIKGKSPLHKVHGSILTSKYENCEAALKVPQKFEDNDIELFVRELDALIKLSPHPNIIALLGWTIHKSIPALVVEIAQTNLLAYVKDLRNQQLPLKQIFSILWQISQALEYLSTFSMVHRDVACRNVLLIDEKTAKLADFGLCCYCDNSFTYRATPQKEFPVKWLSLEALIDRAFSDKSDVWSFGVLCYEVFSYGSTPYTTVFDFEMLNYLKEGNRLEKPAATSDAVYELMRSCWKEAPEDRPTFTEIGNFFSDLLKNETADYGYLAADDRKE